jgi:hypothetical protein
LTDHDGLARALVRDAHDLTEKVPPGDTVEETQVARHLVDAQTAMLSAAYNLRQAQAILDGRLVYGGEITIPGKGNAKPIPLWRRVDSDGKAS